MVFLDIFSKTKAKKNNTSKVNNIRKNTSSMKGKWIQSEDDLPRSGHLLTFENKKNIIISENLKKHFGVYSIGNKEVIILESADNLFANEAYNVKKILSKEGIVIKDTYKIDSGFLVFLYKKAIEKKQKTTEYESEESDKFFDYIRYAVENNVSDVHFEVRENKGVIRMRKLGELQDYSQLDPDIMTRIVRGIYNTKTETEGRDREFIENKGQSASIVINEEIKNKKIKLRYQSIPSLGGFDVVFRILPISNNVQITDLVKLGYSESQKNQIEDMISKPVGAIIIAGTTGSGKTTTLKNLIMEINENYSFTRKMYTIEDPPEYEIPNITQIPVNREKGEKINKDESPFHKPIVDLMRADPDIIMIGEVRDKQTAIGIKDLTESGHQVLSTTHAKSSLGIVERLESLGVENSKLGEPDFLVGLIYQKLIPVLCQDCCDKLVKLVNNGNASKKVIKMYQKLSDIKFTQEELNNVNIRHRYNNSDEKICKKCSGLGIVGREVCAEIITPDFYMYSLFKTNKMIEASIYWRSLAFNNKNKSDMTNRTALEHGISKVKMGIMCPFDVETGLGDITKDYMFNAQLQKHGQFDANYRFDRFNETMSQVNDNSSMNSNKENDLLFKEEE